MGEIYIYNYRYHPAYYIREQGVYCTPDGICYEAGQGSGSSGPPSTSQPPIQIDQPLQGGLSPGGMMPGAGPMAPTTPIPIPVPGQNGQPIITQPGGSAPYIPGSVFSNGEDDDGTIDEPVPIGGGFTPQTPFGPIYGGSTPLTGGYYNPGYYNQGGYAQGTGNSMWPAWGPGQVGGSPALPSGGPTTGLNPTSTCPKGYNPRPGMAGHNPYCVPGQCLNQCPPID